MLAILLEISALHNPTTRQISYIDLENLPKPTTLSALAVACTSIIGLCCIYSAGFEISQLTCWKCNKIAKPAKKRPAIVQLILQIIKLILAAVNITLIHLWSKYHGILSVDVNKLSPQDKFDYESQNAYQITVILYNLCGILILILVLDTAITFCYFWQGEKIKFEDRDK